MSTINLSENAMPISTARVVLGGSTGVQSDNAVIAASPAQELATLKNKLSDLQQELEVKKQKINELEKALKASQDEAKSAHSSLEDMQSNLASLQSEAISQGYEDGVKKSVTELLDAQSTQANIWQQTIAQLSAQHDEFCVKLKSQIVDVVMAAVAKIIGDQLADIEAVKRGIDHIVRESGELQSFKIFIASTQYDQLMACKDFKLDSIAGRRVEFFPDPRLEHGGCILEGANGLIDGRYEIQLSRLRTLLQASAPELMK